MVSYLQSDWSEWILEWINKCTNSYLQINSVEWICTRMNQSLDNFLFTDTFKWVNTRMNKNLDSSYLQRDLSEWIVEWFNIWIVLIYKKIPVLKE